MIRLDLTISLAIVCSLQEDAATSLTKKLFACSQSAFSWVRGQIVAQMDLFRGVTAMLGAVLGR
jgi:hypothetical protein